MESVYEAYVLQMLLLSSSLPQEMTTCLEKGQDLKTGTNYGYKKTWEI